MVRDKNNIQNDTLSDELDLLDDIPTLTSLANDEDSLHDYNENCTCINCCAHRVVLATEKKNQTPRISHPKSAHTKPSNPPLTKDKANSKKDYGKGIKMDNVKFTSAWDDWEIE